MFFTVNNYICMMLAHRDSKLDVSKWVKLMLNPRHSLLMLTSIWPKRISDNFLLLTPEGSKDASNTAAPWDEEKLSLLHTVWITNRFDFLLRAHTFRWQKNTLWYVIYTEPPCQTKQYLIIFLCNPETPERRSMGSRDRSTLGVAEKCFQALFLLVP